MLLHFGTGAEATFITAYLTPAYTLTVSPLQLVQYQCIEYLSLTIHLLQNHRSATGVLHTQVHRERERERGTHTQGVSLTC